ncbi:hypothetical protein [Bartonella krasnovii]|uniref:Uncharacterized protein n=1 Tax=Bartonella krasnovii TaxID=2267275 RepID=A0ABY3VZM9_9HYPH|nr:hypothetical protein [Bartonella krasnovii]UNF28716.1 hypothetical protein MNL13_05700 [Bartonella krasnovii]UNF35091.1 hypothetical protein MNL12_05705 [Bartonella krasnovii]UNF36720.1 hypothetical protein MNL11_06415 [Bartonella krasnovii]UNF38264.1 hypothetical protein MNL10_05765 [Bartonella krasnovii]UNF40134.1 hypothetical protein MNL09_06635 [Bartonella krasnovii]
MEGKYCYRWNAEVLNGLKSFFAVNFCRQVFFIAKVIVRELLFSVEGLGMVKQTK